MGQPTDRSTRRGLTFGSVAERYDEFRPTYPPELMADVVALLPGRRVVEIGAGTGKATRLWAGHDLDITAVEPDPAMAAVLTRHCVDRRNVRIEVETFETWQPNGRYDGLVAAQSWHWTDASTRQAKVAELLRSGGVVALFWNTLGHVDADLAARLVEVNEAHDNDARYLLANDSESPYDGWRTELADAPDLTDVEIRSYPWRMRRNARDFVAYANTTSAFLIMEPERRDALNTALIAAIDEHTTGEVELTLRTDLYLARRV